MLQVKLFIIFVFVILAPQYVSAQADVLTHHNDNARTRQNLNETILTPANVRTGSFGTLFSYPVDGYVYAQPLYVSDLVIPGRPTRNVVFVATEHNSILAFDAEDGTVGLLWQTSFIDPANGVTTVPSSDALTEQALPEIGVTGTPVIDRNTGTLYVVAKTREVRQRGVHYVQRLHALDITTGAEKLGSPAVIADTILAADGSFVYVSGPGSAGTAAGNVNGGVFFNALRQFNVSGLLLLNGVVYATFGSYGDNSPNNGWLIGYDAQTLAMTTAFSTTQSGELGSLWMSGSAPATDEAGNIYVFTVNGRISPTDRTNSPYADTILKLSSRGGLNLVDSFPWDRATLTLGSGLNIRSPDALSMLSANGSIDGIRWSLHVDASGSAVLHAEDALNFAREFYNSNTSPADRLGNAINFAVPTIANGHVYVGTQDSLAVFGLLSAVPDDNVRQVSQTSVSDGEPPIDSYSEANQDSTASLNATRTGVGQVFVPSVSATLRLATFYLSRENSPPGTIVARLYATTGTAGSTAVPTGSALATSAAVNVSTISPWPTLTLVTFDFSTTLFPMTGGTAYAIAVEYTGGSGSNTIPVGKDNTGTHAGNTVLLESGVWGTASGLDTIFYVYGDVVTAPGSLQFSAATYSVNESGLSAAITVTRTGGSTGAVGVSFATSNGTATAGADYTTVTTTVSFANGDSANKTVTIPIAEDALIEGNETVNLTLSSPTGGATLGSPATAVLTIVDNDAAGSLQFTAATYSVNESGPNAAITVARTGGSTGAVGVSFATSNGTATAGADYTTVTTTVSFANGDTADKTVTIPISEDVVVEGSETVNLTLSSPTGGATLGSPATAVLTIVDNDVALAGSLQFTAATYSVNESGPSAAITVTRTGGSTGAVGVSFATSNGTATAGADYTTVTTTVSFANGDSANKTVTIPISEDVVVEGSETVNLTLSSPTGGATLGSPATAVLTIVDNDVALAGSLQFTAATYSVNESGPSVSILVSRTGGSAGAVGVNFATSNGTATAGADYTAVTTTVSFANGDSANKTVTIPISEDVLVEGSETVNLTLSSPTGGATLGSPATAVLTIVDNDVAPPTLIDSYSEANQDSTASLNATRTGVGQVFVPSVSATLRLATFYLSRENSPPGTIVAKLYATTGTAGSTAVPTGSALATSAAVNVSTISPWPTLTLVTFDFSTTLFPMTGGTAYAIAVEYTGGSGSNTIPVGKDNTGTHAGNTVLLESGVWGTASGLDTIFYVYGDVVTAPGSLQFSAATYSVNESGLSAAITVTRTGGSTGAVGVSFATSNGTATAGADYTTVTTTVSFANGDSANKTVTIPIAEDALIEGNETVNLTLSSPTGGATLGSPATAVLTIVDNDAAGSLQFTAATYSVNESGPNAAITVARTGGSTGAVGVSFATSNGTATAGADYTTVTTTVSFANGDTADKTVTIPISEDVVVEGSETVNLTLSSPTGGATLGSPATAVLTIVDNDVALAGSLQFTAATYSVNESGPSAAITVTRTGGSTGAVGVSFATSNGTATAGADYTTVTTTVSFANGDSANKTVTIPISEDVVVEGSETVNLTLSSPTGGATLGSPATAVLTIVDNDVALAGSLQFTAATYSVNESGPSVSILVSRTGGSAGAVGVNFATSNGTATAGADYTAVTTTVSFANGDSANKTVTIPISEDVLVEGSEAVNLTLSSPTGGATLGSPATAVLTIVDNDVAPPTLIDSYSEANQDSTASLNATRTGVGQVFVPSVSATLRLATFYLSRENSPPGTIVAKLYATTGTAGSTAVPTGSALATSAAVNVSTISPWPTLTLVTFDFSTTLFPMTGGTAYAIAVEYTGGSGSNTIPVGKDNTGTHAGNTVLLESGVWGTASGLDTIFYVYGDVVTAPGSLQFSAATYSVNESGLSAAITVTRTGGSTGAVGVSFATSNGTATAGADYTTVTTTVSFANGDSANKTVTIPIAEDALIEGNETVNLTLSSPTGGATLGSPATAVLTIVDNDAAGSLQFTAATYSVNESGPNAAITVARTGGSTGAVGVSFATSNGTATAGADYTTVTTTVSFANGDTADKTVTIPISEDVVVEGNETVNLTLSSPTGGATLGSPATAVLTIVDNDVALAGSLQFTAATYSVNESGPSAAITVTRTGGSTGAVGVSFATSNGTATAGADYTTVTTTVSFANGDTADKTVTIPISEDVVVEGNETVNLTLSSPTGGATLGSPATAVLTIVDNDVALAGSLQFTAATYSVNESGPSVSILVSRTGGSAGAVGVNFATSNGTATAGADYTAVTTTVSFANGDSANKTVTIPISEDVLVEGSETVNLTLSSPTGGATLGSPATAVLTIVDNDVAPPTLIDSYSEANYTAPVSLNVTRTGVGQAFTAGLSATIRSAKFYLCKENSPTGTIVAKLYATTGPVGSTAVPTGSALATSAGLNVSTFTSWPTLALVTFDFSASPFVMSAGTAYAIVLEYTGGSSTNTIPIAKNNAGTHPGNKVELDSLINGGAWHTDPGLDTIFYVYGDVVSAPGSLQFSAATYSVNESGPNAAITVTRTGGSTGAVGVSFATSNGTATAGADYTTVTTTVSFANGDSANKTVTIPIAEDALIEGNETVNLTLSSPTGGATLGSPATAVLTIVDNDAAGSLQFTAATYSVNESGPNAAITVARTGGSTGAVGVSFATSNGTATAGADYTTVTTTVSFANGDTADKTVTIPISEDVVVEGNETVNLTLSSPTGGATLGSPATAVLTIVDNDVALAGSLQFSAATYSVNESGPSAAITVTRTGGSTGAVGVSFATSNGSATAGADYTTVTTTVSFANGDSANKTVTISISEDAVVEGNETVNLTLSSPTGGATLGSPATAVLTIVDNDAAPPTLIDSYSEANYALTVSLNATRTGVGQAFTAGLSATIRSAKFYLCKENSPTGTIVAKLYATTGPVGSTAVPTGSALATSAGLNVSTFTSWPTLALVTFDFSASPFVMSAGTAYAIVLEYAGGSSTNTIPIAKNDAGTHPGNKVELDSLKNGGDWHTDPGLDTVFYVYGDVVTAPGSLQFSAATYNVNESGPSAAITVTRTGGSTGAVGVSFATSNGTATAGADYTTVTTTVSFANGDSAGKTVTIPISEDALIEGNETVNLTLSSPTGGATLGSPATAVLTIVDNDAAPAGSLQFTAATYSVNESGPSASILVSRTGGSAGAVGVNFATSNGTATASADYTAVTTTVSFANGDSANKTVTIPISQDVLVEGNETVNLTLSSPTGGATLGSPATAVLTIVDNDSVLIDSYSEANYTAPVSLNATRTGVGQAFTAGLSATIRSAKFYLCKENSPTGTIVAKLYATTGPVGSTAVPTGSALATSAGLNVSTFTSWPTLALVTFDFSASPFVMSAGTAYAIVLEYAGGSSTNTIPIAKNNAGTHPGNKVELDSLVNGGAWHTNPGLDTIFYVYGDLP